MSKVVEYTDRDHDFPAVESRFVGVTDTNADELFSGYDRLEAITFSYDLGFIEEISDKFKEMTVILGCEALVRDDAFELILASQEYIVKEISSHKKLMERVRDGSVAFKVLKSTISHQKIYILTNENDDHNRMIYGSANFTRRGFSGPGVQWEVVNYTQDDPEALDFFCSIFYTLDMECTNEVPKKTLLSAENGELNLEEIPVAKEIMTNNVKLVLEREEKEDNFNEVEFITNIGERAKEFKRCLPKLDPTAKHNYITPERIRTFLKKNREEEEQHKKILQDYPKLYVDYDAGSVFLNGKAYDLQNIDPESVRNDLTVLKDYFDGYDDFIGSTVKTKQVYYRVMNFMLLSPFIAMLRYVAHYNSFAEEYFPYYAILCGKKNAGKTMFVKTIQRLMTGRDIEVMDCNDFTVGGMMGSFECVQGIPVCLDDMTSSKFATADKIVKNDVALFTDKYAHHGTYIITTNQIDSPKAELVKRMISVSVSGTQTNTDAVSKKKKVHTLLEAMTTSFYRAYLKKMLPLVNEMIDRMRHFNMERDAGWQPDIFKVSSEVIVQIYNACGMELPEYVTELEYADYFGYNTIGEDPKEVITKAWQSDRNAFQARKKENLLEYTPGEHTYEVDKLIKILPETLQAYRVGKKLVMPLDKAQEFFGMSFRKGLFRR